MKRLSSFWSPQPGEMIYSVLVRQFYREWHPTFGVFIRGIYKSQQVFGTLQGVFPSHMPVLQNRLPEEHPLADLDELTYSHTPLGWIGRFQPNDVRRELGRRWLFDRPSSLRSYIGANGRGRKLRPALLRYCPQCADDDRQKLVPPMPIWRMVHQLPTVFVCPWHQVALADGCLDCGGPEWTRHAALLPTMCSCGKTTRHRLVKAPFKARLKTLHELAVWSLDIAESRDEALAQSSHSTFWKSYQMALGPDRMRTKLQLLEMMQRRFSPELIEYSGLLILPSRPDTAFKERSAKMLQVICRTLMLMCSFDSYQAFTEALRNRQRSQLHPDSDGRLRLGRKKKLPKLVAGWKAKVQAMIDAKPRVQAAIAMLEAGEEKRKIKRDLKLANNCINRLCDLVPNLQLSWEKAAWSRYRSEHREIIQKHLESRQTGAAGPTVTAARRANDWLYLHDRKWLLEARRIAGKKAKGISRRRTVTMAGRRNLPERDWVARDAELLEQVKRQKKEWARRPPDFRISVAAILRDSPWIHLYYWKRAYFPQSAAEISSMLETPAQFYRRQLRSFAESANEKNLELLSTNHVADQARIHPKRVRQYWNGVLDEFRAAAVA